jgi:hypothetical protein
MVVPVPDARDVLLVRPCPQMIEKTMEGNAGMHFKDSLNMQLARV